MATGTSPRFSSGAATTAHSRTLGCAPSATSISTEEMFSPDADDDVLRAVLDEHVAGLVDGRHVAGVQPAVANRGRGRLGVAVVAVHHRVAADDDLADLLAVGPDVAPLGVDDPDADTGDRPAGHRLALQPAFRGLAVGQDRLGWARVTIGDVSVSP